MKKLALLAAVVMVLAIVAVPTFAADVTGNWVSKMETPRGTMERTFVLKQDGDKLTGKIVTQRGEQEIKEGKVDGDNIEFKTEMRMGGGDPVTVTYKAKVSGDKMEGSMQMGDRGERPFSATKQAK